MISIKNKAGFTFIDFIALLFLFGIVSVIFYPKILRKLDYSRQNRLIKNVNNIINEFDDQNYKKKMLFKFENGVDVSNEKLKSKLKIKNGIIIVDNNNNVSLSIHDGKYCAKKIYYDDEITLLNIPLYDCYLPYFDISGASVPVLYDGMIPVTWDGSKWVKANISEEWYNYDEKKWANAVLIKELDRDFYINSPPNTLIDDFHVLAHFVWIPRYRYQLFNVDFLKQTEKEINIKFESISKEKSIGSSNNEWLTHPAFTFGEVELDGIWVGKFETTGTRSKPTIKPNMTSLAFQNIGSMFNIARSFNNKEIYGLNFDADTHMMKNIEWGAVAYLAHSEYGKNDFIWVNPSKDFITGCAGDTPFPKLSPGCPNNYDTKKGQQASTTGNVYGIYDMSGGTAEYVVGGLYNKNKDDIMLSLATFTNKDLLNSTKYIDKYNYGTSDNDQDAYNRSFLGDATGETRNWYNNDSEFLKDNPIWNGYGNLWFIRGGYYNDQKKAGIFSFKGQDGANYKYNGFRVVIPGINKNL